MSRELVTLLRELEGGIPRVGPQGGSVTLPGIELPPRATQRRVSAPSHPQRSMSADAATMPPPVAVERPYDVQQDDNNINSPPSPPLAHWSHIERPPLRARTPPRLPRRPIPPAPPPRASPTTTSPQTSNGRTSRSSPCLCCRVLSVEAAAGAAAGEGGGGVGGACGVFEGGWE